MTRLTDEELARLADDPRSSLIYDAIAELQARRAADLSSEDREALEWAREWLALQDHVPNSYTNQVRHRHALSVLDRLLNGGGE